MAIESPELNNPETSEGFDVSAPKLNIPNTSGSVKAAIKSKSVENMPDNPSEMGWKAGDIKKRFYAPIYDDKNSVLTEINRVITEINAAFVEALTYIKKIEVAAATSDAGKVDKINLGGIVYGTESDKDPIGLQYSSNMIPWAIARYNAGNENDEGKATFKVGKPLTDEDATPKRYVNDLVNDLVKDLIRDISFERSEVGSDIFKLTITPKEGETITKKVDLHLESLVTKVDEIERDGVYYLQLTFQDGSTAEYALDDIFAGVNDLLNVLEKKVNEQKAALDKKVDKIEYSTAIARDMDTAVYAVTEIDTGTDIPVLVPVKMKPKANTVVRRDANGNVRVPDLNDNSPKDAAINKTSLAQKINDKGEEVKAYTDGQITEAKQYSDDKLAPVENRVSALENTLLTLERDTSVTYAKAVPANAYPKAFLNSIGGMTYRRVADNLFPCPEEGITRIVEPMIGFGEVYLPAGTYSYSVDATYEYEEEDRFSYLGFMSNPYNATDPTGFVELSTPFTLTETTKVYLIGIKEGAYMGGNVTAKVMLNDGSTVKAFSAYFPPYLEDSKVTEVISHGANLIPFPYTFGGVGAIRKAHGITWTVNADGSITANGTAIGASTFRLADANSFTLPRGVYTLSGCPSDGSISSYYFFADVYNNGVYVTEALDVGTGSILNVTNQTYTGIVIDLAVKTGTVCNNLTFYPMLNYGTTAVPYTPYREPISYPIPEAVQALDGYGKGVSGYSNYIDLERKVFVQRTKRLVFDGTEPWQKSDTMTAGVWRKYVEVTDRCFSEGASTIPPIVCNHYETASASNNYSRNQSIATNKSGFYIYDSAYDTDDVSLWKAHLAELYANGNPLVIEYALAEPTEEALAAEFDKKIDVFVGGYLEFKNDKGNAVPSEVAFITSK